MPKILDEAVAKLKAKGTKASTAYPIAVATLQRSGALKAGTAKPTKKGARRGQMTPKERAATR